MLATLAKDFLFIIDKSVPIERKSSELALITNNRQRNRISALRITQLISLGS